MAKKKENKKAKAPNQAKVKEPFSFEKFWCVWNIVEATLILAAGICALIFLAISHEDVSQSGIVLNNILPYVVGAFVVMDATLRVILALNARGKETDESILLVAGFEFTAGALIMIFHDQFTRLIINAIAILMIAIGILMALFSAMVIVKKSKKLFVPIMEIIFAAILVGVGIAVLVLYYMPSSTDLLVLIVAGIIFTMVGLGQLIVSCIKLSKLRKGEKLILNGEEHLHETKKAKTEAIDVEEADTVVIDVEEEPKAIEHKKK